MNKIILNTFEKYLHAPTTRQEEGGMNIIWNVFHM